MTLALDPRLPLLWRTPHSVQFGVDDPPVTLTSVTTAQERMLAGLVIGLTPEGLLLIGTESGLDPEQVEEFARRIQPALLAPRSHTSACVEVDGSGPTADRLEWRLREAGMEPRRSETRQGEFPSAEPTGVSYFAIVVGDYVLDPERRGRWLRRDIPHLPIIFGDTSVTLGPFIDPGTGPCLYCLELHRRDADPAWPTLASQLLGKKSAAQSAFVASETATLATRMVMARIAVGPNAPVSSTAITLDAATGQLYQRLWQAHPECACSGISIDRPGQISASEVSANQVSASDVSASQISASNVNAQGLRETVMGSSRPVADHSMQTTKGGELSVPA